MTKKFSFVNIIFFVVFGVLTGVLWAYLCPIPLIPGAVHFRTFAFIIVVIGYLFGPVTGFFAGYIGTIVWALLSGNFIPLHSPLADGITVGLSAALPALIHLRNGKKDLLELTANKGKFIAVSLFWSILFGILTVSYTHLDVYKRQGCFSLFPAIRFLDRNCRCGIPVSYTHLDVYKRQQLRYLPRHTRYTLHFSVCGFHTEIPFHFH